MNASHSDVPTISLSTGFGDGEHASSTRDPQLTMLTRALNRGDHMQDRRNTGWERQGDGNFQKQNTHTNRANGQPNKQD